MGNAGRKRTVSYEAVIEFKCHHPEAYQTVIAKYFQISQKQVSRILRSSGIFGKRGNGRPLKKREYWSEEQFYWEKVLVTEGLGMDQGVRVNNRRIFYCNDPNSERHKEEE